MKTLYTKDEYKLGGKRLYFIVNANLPNERAHGIQSMQMCAAFAENGYKTVLLLPYKIGSSDNKIKDFYGIEDTFLIKHLPIFILPKYFGKVAFLTRWLSFSVSILIYLFIIGRKNDIVYVRGEMVLPMALISKRVSLCWETHIKPGRMKLYMWAMNRCKLLVTATKIYREELINTFNVPENKIITEPDGVDIDKFNSDISIKKSRDKLELPQDRKIILYTGTDIPWKGLSVFKDAVRLLPDSYLAVFVGDIKEDYKEDKRFLYVGFKNHIEIPLWLASADYLIVTGSHTSVKSQLYTSPLKLFEYMASKKPIIAFDIQSFREVLNTGNAFFVSPDSPEKISKQIIGISDNQSALKAEKAFSDVKKYSWYLRVSRILNKIESLK